MRWFLFVAFLFLFTGTGRAQSDSAVIRSIAQEVFRNSGAYDNLYSLTKHIGPRLSGSPQTYLAEKWAQEALKQAGADKIFLQETKIPH